MKTLRPTKAEAAAYSNGEREKERVNHGPE